MKSLMIFLILLFSSLITKAGIMDGGADSGGGSGYASEFMSLGRDVAVNLDKVPGFPVTSARFLQAIQNTKIEFTEERVGNDGISNQPKASLIRISRKLWKSEYSNDADKYTKRQMVIHQYLIILGIEDSELQWTRAALDGGKAIATYECSNGILGDTKISARAVDTLGDGKIHKFAGSITIKSMIFGSMTSSLITLMPTDQGLVMSWLSLGGGLSVLLPQEELHVPNSFKVKVNKVRSYSEDGTPNVKVTDSMTCKVK